MHSLEQSLCILGTATDQGHYDRPVSAYAAVPTFLTRPMSRYSRNLE